jgi:protocatechuate 3,4-dioxygenase beta subunit
MKTLFLAIAVLLPLAQTPPAAPHAETASIRGRITDKVSGEPIARAVVTASPADGRSRATATLADADGRYAFPMLVPGRYFIRAEPPLFGARYVGAAYTGTASPNMIMTLKSGEERTSIDIALQRAYAITGRVVDVDGEPAARVRIVTRAVGANGRRGPDRETDDLGRFRIFGLLPGRYTVCSEFISTVSMQVRSELEQPVTTCYPSATSSVEGRPVEVKSADVDGIEIRLLRTRTFTIRGTVLDSTGKPAENAQVDLEKHIAGGSSSTVISGGPDGQMVMRNITPGDYVINASIGGPYRPAERRELEVASVPITVGSADVDVVLTMSRTMTVPGRIVFEGTTTPPPRDPGYAPMIVFAKFPDGVERSSVRTSITVDDGTFQLPDMFGPRVLDVVNAPSGWVLKSITYRGKDVTDAVVDLQAGGEVGTIEVVMHNRGAVVTGRVVDDGGKPVRARVVMIPVDRVRWLGLYSPVTALSSATAGTYAFRPQRAGEYAIVAIDQAEPIPSEQDRAFFERIVKSGQTITLAENERRAVDLRVSKLVEDR